MIFNIFYYYFFIFNNFLRICVWWRASDVSRPRYNERDGAIFVWIDASYATDQIVQKWVLNKKYVNIYNKSM